MKLAKTILAIALPIAVLSTGCALDVGTSGDGLTIDRDSDFGVNSCGEPTFRWLGEAEWPIETIVAGDMEFTKDDLVDYVKTAPASRATLVADMAAVQLNMALGVVIPDSVLDDLVTADDLLMAPTDDVSVPPPVNLDDFNDLVGFGFGGGVCLELDPEVAEIAAGTVDLRDNITIETAGSKDIRFNIAKE